jgi:predicted ATP-grasp superfamily ATP-dependent carboligase
MPMNIKEAKIVLFADDKKILVTEENVQIIQQKINRIMNELHSWFYANILILNTVKTIAMPFHTMQERHLMNSQIKFGKWILHINQKQNLWHTH